MPWEFMEIEPQPARGKMSDELWGSSAWQAEEKYDGDRRIAQFCGEWVRFTGRRRSVETGAFVDKTTNLPHLSGVRTMGAPAVIIPSKLDGTVLDGEIIVSPDIPIEGGRSKMVTSIMGSLPEEAVRKQRERGWLHYVVFDCLFYKGRDLRKLKLTDRQNYIESVISDWCPRYAMDVPKSISERYHRKMYDKIVERGGEGIIFKRKDHLYGDKTGWVKVKKTMTADVVITGFVSAKEMSKKKGDDKPTMTKYAKEGLIGAIICSQLTKDGWVEVATISGITDALRRDMTKNPGRYEHRVVEIEHNGREPSGRFRHPRFNRFRDDKRTLECVHREDES